MTEHHDLPTPVSEFLAAVNDRDATRAGACFTEDGRYHFLVPQPPVVGRDAIIGVLTGVLGACSRVQWDVVTSARNGDHVFLERVDRFFYGNCEAAMECNGVIVLSGGSIQEIRDYADHETWRARKEAARVG